jgi:carbamoyl-phosphate synthase large subunit
MKKIKILVTGANGDIGEAVGRILRQTFPASFIHGADAKGKYPGIFVFSDVFELPFASENSYIEKLIEFSKSYDLIIPTSEPEIKRITEEISVLKKLPILIVQSDIVKTFSNKFLTSVHLDKLGYNVPRTQLIEDITTLKFPLYLKPSEGAGGRNHYIIEDSNELKFISSKVKPNSYVAQEFLSGEEYTCAIFRNSNTLRNIAFRRELHFDKTVKAEVQNIPVINEMLSSLGNDLLLHGSINVQLKMINDRPVIFEINPRLSSTVMMRHLIGFNDLVWWIEDFLNYDLSQYIEPKIGTTVYRMSAEKVFYPS